MGGFLSSLGNFAKDFGQGMVDDSVNQSPILGGIYRGIQQRRQNAALQRASNIPPALPDAQPGSTDPGAPPPVSLYPRYQPSTAASADPMSAAPQTDTSAGDAAAAHSSAVNAVLETQQPNLPAQITNNTYNSAAARPPANLPRPPAGAAPPLSPPMPAGGGQPPPRIGSGSSQGQQPPWGGAGGAGGQPAGGPTGEDPTGGDSPVTQVPPLSGPTDPGPPPEVPPYPGGGGGGGYDYGGEYGDSMAQGGIVTQPSTVRIAERGPEAVIPLTPRAGNRMQPDLLEGRISNPKVPGVKYSRYRTYDRLGAGQGGQL